MSTLHTKTPWNMWKDSEGNITISWEPDGSFKRSICDIVGTMPIDEANAKFIVKAVNSHEKLREALVIAEHYLNNPNELRIEEMLLTKIRPALKESEA